MEGYTIMETLDLFKDWTPKMIEALRYQGAGCRSKERYGNMTEEERKELAVKGFCSPECNSRKSEVGLRTWASLSPGGRKERTKNYVHNGAKISESLKEYLGKLTPEEMEDRMRNSLLNEASLRKRSEAAKEMWANLSEDERNEWVGNMHAKSPTFLEVLLGIYLESNFPRKKRYNGNGPVVIGGRKPDFVDIDGEEVIEEMGIYWHPGSDEQDRIEHYARYGVRCIVVWEYDCYFPNELDKIFKKVERKWEEVL